MNSDRPGDTLARSTDSPGGRKVRTRKLKVLGVSLDLDETAGHWLVYVSPSVELAALGIGPYRAKLHKCRCASFSGNGNRCRECRGWSHHGTWSYVIKLLRRYPKITVEVPAPPRLTREQRQRLPDALRWAGRERGWVAV